MFLLGKGLHGLGCLILTLSHKIYTPTEYNNQAPTPLCHILWIIPIAITSSIDVDAPI